MEIIIHLKPGKYFVGDPTHVANEAVLAILKAVTNPTVFASSGGHVEIAGVEGWVMYPLCGNGLYHDQNSNAFEVLDNLFGAIPIEWVDSPEGEEEGTIVDAPTGLTVQVVDGVITIGELNIDTNEN